LFRSLPPDEPRGAVSLALELLLFRGKPAVVVLTSDDVRPDDEDGPRVVEDLLAEDGPGIAFPSRSRRVARTSSPNTGSAENSAAPVPRNCRLDFMNPAPFISLSDFPHYLQRADPQSVLPYS